MVHYYQYFKTLHFLGRVGARLEIGAALDVENLEVKLDCFGPESPEYFDVYHGIPLESLEECSGQKSVYINIEVFQVNHFIAEDKINILRLMAMEHY